MTMKKITPVVTSFALAGFLASCGTSTTPVTPDLPKAQQLENTLPINPAVVPADTTSLNSTKVVTKTVGYVSPAGQEEIEVTLNISNNTITSVLVKPMATNEISKKLQTGFAHEIKIAVGKPITAFSLDAVGGASLTTKAFNAYVQSL